MRVAWVMPGAGVVGRGAEAFVLEIAAALARRGIEPVIFCRGAVPLPHRRVRAVPRDARWLVRLHAATRLGRKALDTLFLDPLNVEWATASLAAFPALWRGGYDVVVIEGGLVGAWLCRLLRRARGVPFVDVAHGVDPKWEGAFARQRPDRVVAFTRAAAETIAARAPRARIEVVPHGVDLDRFRPGAPPAALDLPRPVVMTAGAVDAHKRHDRALLAVARLAEHGRPASLLVAGDGPGAAALDALGARHLPGRYRRLAVPRDAMPALYAAADLFTLPSRTESFGLAYLEAMAAGVACVAPDDAVRREVIGDAGLYADPDDLDAYAAALAAAVDRDWGETPRRRAERFPFAATADAWERLLAGVTREAA
ncbi:MAG TPA: glycosyltransferase family 4 protein [Thermoanaerobaculia bacterium]|nr:glycosyltransferase family 4 protein [Thermoanaerobaculia bacterium]